MARTHSDEYISGLMSADPNRNRNVEWLRTPFLLPLYVVFIALFFGVVHGTSLLSTGGSWAVTNAAHGLITFIVFHWWKVRSICAVSSLLVASERSDVEESVCSSWVSGGSVDRPVSVHVASGRRVKRRESRPASLSPLFSIDAARM